MSSIPFNRFPKLLKEISSPPISLYYAGDPNLLSMKTFTVVGTRDISEYGAWCIENLLGTFLKDLDICVVSGLARGVDAHVHRVCLERGIKNIAIVPGYLDSAIPLENREIFENLKKEGLILYEFPKETTFRKEMFVLRNRLLAGISKSTLVIEAGLKSGSLITAQFALDFNREVYVIPGDIGRNTSQGCNMLLKEGAGVVMGLESLKEIFGVQNDQLQLS